MKATFYVNLGQELEGASTTSIRLANVYYSLAALKNFFLYYIKETISHGLFQAVHNTCSTTCWYVKVFVAV